MIETAVRVSEGRIGLEVIEKVVHLGKELLNKPVEILPGVEEMLKALQGKYRLVMATKGDLLDQGIKLEKSGLEEFFHHIEIVADKKEKEYKKLISPLDISPDEFLMIGNSLKSDILHVLKMGGFGFHVPYHTTWEYEKIDIHINDAKFRHFNTISEVLTYL